MPAVSSTASLKSGLQSLWTNYSRQPPIDSATSLLDALPSDERERLVAFYAFVMDRRDDLLQLDNYGTPSTLRSPDSYPSLSSLARFVVLIVNIEHGMDTLPLLSPDLRQKRFASLALDLGLSDDTIMRCVKSWLAFGRSFVLKA